MNLHDLQSRVHVAKDKKNDFGGYNYRTAEGILAAAKAALPDGASIIVTDDIREVAGQIFVQSTATVIFPDGITNSAVGFAMHPLTKKGMDPSQITGSASSYARKYALGGLLALDDGSADPDAAREPYEKEAPPKPSFDSAATRDRIKAAIERCKTETDLAALWQHKATAAAMEKLSPPHQGELSKAYDDQAAALRKDQKPDDAHEYS